MVNLVFCHRRLWSCQKVMGLNCERVVSQKWHKNCLIPGEMLCPAGFTLDFCTNRMFTLLLVRDESSILRWKSFVVVALIISKLRSVSGKLWNTKTSWFPFFITCPGLCYVFLRGRGWREKLYQMAQHLFRIKRKPWISFHSSEWIAFLCLGKLQSCRGL